MNMDREKIEFHVRGLLEAIGEDPDRELRGCLRKSWRELTIQIIR